ncbi:DinB/UmuC family translesion DNA polymerase [Kitasatospora indigofera]|uniref:DinB/UmuC family translesion DNA polymerase n=1 Tax=Kitasatospora indigofera TaxID=67307 RepID=UPI0036ADC87B
MLDRAHGHDPRPVTTAALPATTSTARALTTTSSTPDQIRRALLDLAGDLVHRLRTGWRTCRQLELQVTFADRSHTIRSRILKDPTDHGPVLTEVLYAMFARWACSGPGFAR